MLLLVLWGHKSVYTVKPQGLTYLLGTNRPYHYILGGDEWGKVVMVSLQKMNVNGCKVLFSGDGKSMYVFVCVFVCVTRRGMGGV